ncbi:MAG: hypothetical protein HOP33_08990 [Verrucomicrobia bacterium]|nr:hypothetical protein [Verrucomicrobiota bacterium]
MATIYAGPGKIFINSIALQPEGENGPINISINEETAQIATAMHGRVTEQLVDQTAEITCKPFDNWGSLATLFPARIGAKVGATAAALVIGGRPHGAADLATKVWTPDGRLYDAVRTAVVGHPSLHLGIGKALFGDVKVSVIGATGIAMGASGYLFTANAITESAAADPGGNMTMSDFIRGAWIGAWGAVTGFTAIEAEDEWTVETSVKYSALKVQGRTLAMKLDSVGFMAKVKPYGPTHTQITGIVGGHTQGQRLGSADLILTGPSSKTITLKNAELRGAGFNFGGTSLGTGEIGFVNEMQFTAGAPQSLIEFSA